MKIRISVTQKDIEDGTQHCGTECPVLLRLKKVFGAEVVDRVTRAYIVFRDRPRKKSPASVRNFCKQFDQVGRGAVAPFSFVVEL